MIDEGGPHVASRPPDLDDGERYVRCEPVASDASSRRYSRLWKRSGDTVILARYSLEDRSLLTRDLEVLRWLSDHGLRVPAILGCDVEVGWATLEDFGPQDSEAVLRGATPDRRRELAELACEPLKTLADLDPGRLPRWNPPLDSRRLRWELAGFELWFVRHLRRAAPRARGAAWLDALATEIGSHPRRVCHRDYHLNNLFLLPSGEVGLIDVQDVLVGPDTYDAVSLMEERAMPGLLDDNDRQRVRDAWAATTGSRHGWQERWLRVRAQRGLKVLGTFARLVVAGCDRYRPWLAAAATDLAHRAAELDMPGEMVDLLVD